MIFLFKKILQSVFQKEIYLDHASTTPMDSRVFSAMNDVVKNSYGNPGGMYPLAIRTKRVISDARRGVATILGTTSEHIIFTRGGTESNNLAIQGVIDNFIAHNPGIVPHVITTTIEHDSVLNVIKKLEQAGDITASFVECNAEGIVEVDAIKKELRPETILISVMYANNEIGTIQPIKEIAKLVRWWKKQQALSTREGARSETKGGRVSGAHEISNATLPLNPPLVEGANASAYPLFHTDAIQAANYCDINPLRLGVDLMTLSGSKIYGPKSVGALFVKDRSLINPIIFGGGQEFGLRSGTEDAVLIAGFTEALRIVENMKEREVGRLTQLRDNVITELLRDERITLNGSKINRLPNNINVTISGFRSEQLVIQLAEKGFAVSSKSACQSDSDEESHVIAALRSAQGMGSLSDEGSLRITLGRSTTKGQLEKFLKELKKISNK